MNRLFIIIFYILIVKIAFAQNFKTKSDHLKWWQDSRFGMFIHWGPVSLMGTEIGWSRGTQIPAEKYDTLYKQFNPVKFNADEWVSVAKAAGMKYIVLTTKHHDGFCLWDTRETNYNIMNTPFKRDVVKELSEACKKQGIAFGTYYSTCDWYHPDFPLTSPGGKTLRPYYDLERYTRFLKAQVTELLTKYGPLAVLWFDVPQRFDSIRGKSIIQTVSSIQPDIIINNRTGAKGDFDTPEQKIGKFQNSRPWETCMTICEQWAWKPNDKLKSLKQCIHGLVKSAGGDGNFLLNVGPMPNGEIEARQITRLKEMGNWLKLYGGPIYETRGGPYMPSKEYACTYKGNTVYIHVLNWSDNKLILPAFPKKIKSGTLLSGEKVSFTQTNSKVEIFVAPGNRDSICTIVKLQIDGLASEIMPIQPVKEKVTIIARASNYHWDDEVFGPGKAVDNDKNTRWATNDEKKQAWIELDFQKEKKIRKIAIDEAFAGRIKKFKFEYKSGNEWKLIFEGDSIGSNFTRQFDTVNAQIVRLTILEATVGPTINEITIN